MLHDLYWLSWKYHLQKIITSFHNLTMTYRSFLPDYWTRWRREHVYLLSGNMFYHKTLSNQIVKITTTNIQKLIRFKLRKTFDLTTFTIQPRKTWGFNIAWIRSCLELNVFHIMKNVTKKHLQKLVLYHHTCTFQDIIISMILK